MGEKILVKVSLVVGFCGLVLVVLICGLSTATKAERAASYVSVTPEGNLLGSLEYETGVSVCRQTTNRAPNGGFEWDGEPWTDHWYESGQDVCDFTYDDPGHGASEVSAQINASLVREKKCMLFTPIEEIEVVGGLWYDYAAWVLADLSQGDAYLHIHFWGEEEGELKYEGGAETAHIEEADEWVEISGSVRAPDEAKFARLAATLPGSSKGWVRFDDIYLGLATCLEIDKRDEPDPVFPGERLTYTIVYSNTGRQAATDVRVIESYCCQDLRVVESVEWSEPSPIPYTDNIWEIPDVSGGTSGMISVRVKLIDDLGQRASIVNGVQIRSEETRDPVYTTTSTMVRDGGGSDIGVYLPQPEKLGEPGCVIDYDLDLTNMGSCSGQGYVTATSSQGWDVVITPEPPYTMPPGVPQQVTVGVDVPGCAGRGITDVTSITATLECGPPCNERVTRTRVVTTTVGQEQQAGVYLPMVLREWPPVLASPSLYFIDNPGGDGCYDVHWTEVDWADSYVLEEDTDKLFTYPMEVCVGNSTSCPIEGRGAARYYYRVKSRNSWGDSAWSNRQATDVVWELEPNGQLSKANGPLARYVEYHGHHSSDGDEWDCFKIHSNVGGLVTAELHGHECTDVWFLLHYESADNEVDADHEPPYDLSYNGPRGWYYISIYTDDKGCSIGIPYTLDVTFPDSGLE